MKKPKKLVDFDDNWERQNNTDGEVIVNLYKKLPAEFIDEYNNLVEVVNQNGEVLITLISWLQRELGAHGIKQLLEMMPKDEQ